MIWLRSTAIISSGRHCAHSDKNLSHPWGHHEPTQTIYIDVKWCAWDMIDEMNGIVVDRTYRQTCAAGNSNQPIVYSALSDQYGNGPSFVALHFRLRHMSEHREHCTVKVWFWARQMERLIVREYIYSVLATRAECTCWLICSVLCVCFAHTPNQYRSTVEGSIQWAPILSSENIFFLLSIAPTNMFITSIRPFAMATTTINCVHVSLSGRPVFLVIFVVSRIRRYLLSTSTRHYGHRGLSSPIMKIAGERARSMLDDTELNRAQCAFLSCCTMLFNMRCS